MYNQSSANETVRAKALYRILESEKPKLRKQECRAAKMGKYPASQSASASEG